MLSVLKALDGIVLVTDTWGCPCNQWLELLCRDHPDATVISLDVPRHRLSYVAAAAAVVDLYGQDVAELPPQAGKRLVVIDGIGRLLERLGLAAVMRSVLQWRATCVVLTMHADVVPGATVAAIAELASAVVSFGPEEGAVATVSRRKGGKVVRSWETVETWRGPVVKLRPKKSASAGASSVVLEEAGDRRQEVLPFLKTAVEGKMIFDVEDMKMGDYEDNADADDDPDADLDV
jgi:hypothetical protein